MWTASLPQFSAQEHDSRVVSLGLYCKTTRVLIQVGAVKFSDGICKYLLRMSWFFVEIMDLFVVSVCINIVKLRHCW